MRVTYIERSPGNWRLRIETGKAPDGRRLFSYETVKGTEEDAQRRRFDILRAFEEGSFAKPDRLTIAGYLGRPEGKPKEFSAWVGQRLALGKIGRSTAEHYQIMLDAYVVPKLGAVRLQKVEAHQIQGLYTALLSSGTLSLTSAANLHATLSIAFKSARRAKLIKVNPIEEVEPPQRTKPAPKALDEAGMARVVEACEGDWKWPIAVLAFGAGLRRGEVLGLRRRDVDLAGATLRVAGQLVQYKDGTREWKAPKTAAGVRTVALSAELVAVLRDVLRVALEARMRAGIAGAGLDDAPVFSFDGCSFIRPDRLTNSFDELCDRIGLPAFTFHGTRHTHATALLRRVGKTGAKAVSQRLGHADVGITLSVYQTVFESDGRELAELMGPILRKND